jgi:glyceraldehyde 3-phosphate dehydrogenase
MKIAINGMGRIGRAALKVILTHQIGISSSKRYRFCRKHIFKYDSVYGVYEKEVTFDDKKIIDKKIK